MSFESSKTLVALVIVRTASRFRGKKLASFISVVLLWIFASWRVKIRSLSNTFCGKRLKIRRLVACNLRASSLFYHFACPFCSFRERIADRLERCSVRCIDANDTGKSLISLHGRAIELTDRRVRPKKMAAVAGTGAGLSRHDIMAVIYMYIYAYSKYGIPNYVPCILIFL